MGGIEESEPTEFNKRNVPACQLNFERPAVMRGAEQYGLLLQQGAALAIVQHPLDDVARLVGLVAHTDKLRPFSRGAIGPKILGEALGGQIDHGICCRKDRLRRPIVSIERDDPRRGAELRREVEDVANRSGAERIDRLGIVSDHRETAASRLERQQDRRLQPVCVLILVDEHMIEAAADVFGEGWLAHHLCQVEQKIVVIEHVLVLLGFDIAGEHFSEFVGPAGAPRKRCTQHLLDGRLGIYAAGIDGKTCGLGREARLRLREPAFVSHEIHQVGGILSIMNCKGPIKADLVGVFAQETRTDSVKRARPGQRASHNASILAHDLRRNPLDPADHLSRRPAGKRQEENAAWIGALDNQVRSISPFTLRL